MARAHAIVLGAGMSGLLAARVLADHYGRVTVLERDQLGRTPHNRRGVPQGRHVHGLLPSGAQVLGELFPGLLDDLVTNGGTRLDDYSRLHFVPDGEHRLSPRLQVESIYQQSRPFLESAVRQRVLALPNVHVVDGCDVVGLATSSGRVVGARAVQRGRREEVLSADLVVDAAGRGSRTPSWLAEMGYAKPTEDKVDIDVRYASRLVRLAPGSVPETLVVIGASAHRPVGMALAAYEDNTWMFTMTGYGPAAQAADYEGMVNQAAEFAPAHMITALREALPLGDVSTFRFLANRRRRYDKLRRFPAGLLVTGDALCAFNPIYGQGMTIAALEAAALRDCLRGGDTRLARRFFRAAEKPVQVAWNMAVGADLALPYVSGARPLSMRLINAYVGRLLIAAQHDPAVAARFLRVSAFLKPPSRLMTPLMMARVFGRRGTVTTEVRRERTGSVGIAQVDAVGPEREVDSPTVAG